MPESKRFLQPVKREDFILAKNANAKSDDLISPEIHFSNLITTIRKFAVGPHFWFIANLINGSVQAAGGMIKEITSITKEDFINGSPDQLFQRTHPDDIQQMFAFSNYWVEFLMSLKKEQIPHVHTTIYIRIKNKEEIYKWVMVQYADQMVDEKGKIIFGLTLVTDIDFIKKDGVAMMSILDTHDETCQHFFCTDGKSIDLTNQTVTKLTNREIEVIGYLAIGYSSKQIASEMKISINTVDNHRQNMLRKTKSKSTGELVNFAIQAGFV